MCKWGATYRRRDEFKLVISLNMKSGTLELSAWLRGSPSSWRISSSQQYKLLIEPWKWVWGGVMWILEVSRTSRVFWVFYFPCLNEIPSCWNVSVRRNLLHQAAIRKKVKSLLRRPIFSSIKFIWIPSNCKGSLLRWISTKILGNPQHEFCLLSMGSTCWYSLLISRHFSNFFRDFYFIYL